ncbi:hypothetical protein SVIOM342S_10617 [Streptomyces violaceorubidus]
MIATGASIVPTRATAVTVKVSAGTCRGSVRTGTLGRVCQTQPTVISRAPAASRITATTTAVVSSRSSAAAWTSASSPVAAGGHDVGVPNSVSPSVSRSTSTVSARRAAAAAGTQPSGISRRLAGDGVRNHSRVSAAAHSTAAAGSTTSWKSRVTWRARSSGASASVSVPGSTSTVTTQVPCLASRNNSSAASRTWSVRATGAIAARAEATSPRSSAVRTVDLTPSCAAPSGTSRIRASVAATAWPWESGSVGSSSSGASPATTRATSSDTRCTKAWKSGSDRFCSAATASPKYAWLSRSTFATTGSRSTVIRSRSESPSR